MREFDPTLFPIEDIEDIKNFFVYQYHFIDYSSFITSAEMFLKNNDFPDVDKYLNELKQLFLSNGWEGDGEIGAIWMPPFLGIDEDTYGFIVWHVKQLNNGTSWIASPKKLPFKSLEEQNNTSSILSGFTVPESIIQGNINSFLSRLKSESDKFSGQVQMLQKLSQGKTTTNDMLMTLHGFTQNQLVSLLNDLMDYCYLRFLVEGISHGNKVVKLRKMSLASNPGTYLPEESEDLGEDSIYWFTVQALISDFWRVYKFLPFKDKLEHLVKAVNFNIDASIRDMILKHVIIRNCIQHHDWILEKTSLKLLGRNSISILSSSKPITIKEWKKIVLTFEELSSLFTVLNDFAEEFAKHVDKHIKTRVYVKGSK